MEIHIDDTKKLSEIKALFSNRYPYLKLEFFNKAHKEGGGSPLSDMITEDVSIGEVRKKHNEGDVRISKEMRVSEVEQLFESQYGIHIQIFRKSGDLWLETSATDQWTLLDQNETGQEMS